GQQGTGQQGTGQQGTGQTGSGGTGAPVTDSVFQLAFMKIAGGGSYPTLGLDPTTAAKPPPSFDPYMQWIVKAGTGTLEYHIPVRFTFVSEIKPTPSGNKWGAVYR